MTITRIGATGGVNRDQASAGHEQIAKAEKHQQPPRNQKVDEVAKLYEKQFLREMFKAMRSTVTPTDEPSMAENIYKNQLDEQYVDAWGDNGGIGLSNMIYEQIMDRYFGGVTAKKMKQQGPVSLSNRDVVSVARMKTEPSTTGQQVPLQVEVKPSETGAPSKIQAPWDAKVLQSTQLEGGRRAVTLEHGEGLRSTLIFNGVPSAETKVGEKISKGNTIGTLAPESKSFLWNLNQPQHERAPAGPATASPAVEASAAAPITNEAAPVTNSGERPAE